MSVRKFSIVATILVLVASQQAMAAPVDLVTMGTPVSIPGAPGQPNMILTPVAHPPGTATAFPAGVTADFSYFAAQERWTLFFTNFQNLASGNTYGFQ